MNYLVVDDEPLARKRLIQLIENQDTNPKITEVNNGKQALEKIDNNTHIVFLDIRMPVMDGIEAARHINKLAQPPVIIFTTAYNEFALDAFENNAIAYLMKPIDQEKLNKAIQQATKLNTVQLQTLANKSQRTHISSKIGSKLQLIEIKDISSFMAEDKYIAVNHKNGKSLIDETIKHLAEEFVEQFIQVHRNALVNKNQIQAVNNKNGKCWLSLKGSEDQIEVSRRSLSAVKKYISLG